MSLLLTAALLLPSLALAAGEVVSIEGVMWQAANVRASVLETSLEQLTLSSELFCAVEAGKRPWCSLYCYAGGICDLYNASFPTTRFLTTGRCKTTLPPISCTPPFASIEWMEDLGCIFMNSTLATWNASREDCLAHEADLFSTTRTDQYVSLKTHFYNTNVRNYKWIGVIGRAWLDGSVVGVWNGGEPNGPLNYCGVMQPSYLMDDVPCSYNFEHVCQANSTWK